MLKIQLRILILSLLSSLLVLNSVNTNAAGRIAVKGQNGAVASSSAIASEIGIQILKEGGNAVDAAIATAFAMAVTLPSAGNIGGGGFLIYHGADGQTSAFDFREKAPLASTTDMYLDENGNIDYSLKHLSILSVGVPGTVAGMELAHQRYGTMEWEDLLSPAIRLAREGFPISWKLHDDFKSKPKREWFNKYPSSKKKFYRSEGSL